MALILLDGKNAYGDLPSFRIFFVFLVILYSAVADNVVECR
jgi:hypothetical protein